MNYSLSLRLLQHWTVKKPIQLQTTCFAKIHDALMFLNTALRYPTIMILEYALHYQQKQIKYFSDHSGKVE